jgi:hypothetical protein
MIVRPNTILRPDTVVPPRAALLPIVLLRQNPHLQVLLEGPVEVNITRKFR